MRWKELLMHYTEICSDRELDVLEYIKSCKYSPQLDRILLTILSGEYYNQWVAEYMIGQDGLNGQYWGPYYDKCYTTCHHSRDK